eukprot:1900688-Amphidinium_carterae.1
MISSNFASNSALRFGVREVAANGPGRCLALPASAASRKRVLLRLPLHPAECKKHGSTKHTFRGTKIRSFAATF